MPHATRRNLGYERIEKMKFSCFWVNGLCCFAMTAEITTNRRRRPPQPGSRGPWSGSARLDQTPCRPKRREAAKYDPCRDLRGNVALPQGGGGSLAAISLNPTASISAPIAR